MKTILASIGFILAVSGTAAVGQQMPKPEAPRTITQVLDRAMTNVEEEFVPAADAMPEDKYGYAPTDGEFKGVRTFAEQVKHVAADNYQFGAAILQVKPTDTGRRGGAGVGENQGPNHAVPERFVCLSAQSDQDDQRGERDGVDEEPVGTEHDHATGNCDADGGALLRSLRTDGGVFAT